MVWVVWGALVFPTIYLGIVGKATSMTEKDESRIQHNHSKQHDQQSVRASEDTAGLVQTHHSRSAQIHSACCTTSKMAQLVRKSESNRNRESASITVTGPQRFVYICPTANL